MTAAQNTTSTNNGHGLVPYMAPAAPAATPELTFNERQVAIIRKMIAPDVNEEELALFLEVCRATGLNPLFKQIYAIVRSKDDPQKRAMTIQTGIDGYRLLASRTGALAGIDDATFDPDHDEPWHPAAAHVTVWKFVQGQRVPFTATARWSEYAQSYKDKQGNRHYSGMWVQGKMPFAQLAKCAEALALRKSSPAELSGIYTGDEMGQADNPSALPYVESEPESAQAAHPAQQPADRASNAMKSKEIMDLLVQRQCFTDRDRRLELDSVFAAIEAAGGAVNAKSVKTELQARLADTIDLSGVDMGMPGN